MGGSTCCGARPLVVVIAGPNGAGKSTLAPYLLRDELAVEAFVNADTIAQGLSAFAPQSVAVAAGRILIERIGELASKWRDFAFETTLAGRAHARRLAELRRDGYRVHVVFLSLPSAELALGRVASRVALGGHHVPDDVVRRRFELGRRNFDALYRHVAGSWQLYDNSTTTPRLLAYQRAGEPPRTVDPAAHPFLGGDTVGERRSEPSDRVDDIERTLRALERATRDAIRRHRATGVPMAVWRAGRVALIEADSAEGQPRTDARNETSS